MRPTLRAAAIVLVSVVLLLPLVFMVAGSLRTPGLPPPDGFEFLPEQIRWANYQSVFAFLPLWTYMRNSLIVVAVAVPITVLLASWAGFAIATSGPRVQRRLIGISVVALMVPVSALWVPRFVMFRWIGITDSLVALMTPALMATTPFFVLIFALAYSRIPKEIFEAARLDGLGPLAMWRQIACPLGRPAAFAVAILAFVFHWSNFIDALLFLSTEANYTLPLALRSLQTLEPTNHPILLAASVLVTVPAVLAFLSAQRAFFAKTLEV